MTFISLVETLEKGKAPEDIFGMKVSETILQEKYREMAMLVHPDKVAPADKDRATKAFQALSEFLARAEKKLAAGTYGDYTVLEKEIVVSTKKKTYTLERRITQTKIATFYTGHDEKGNPITLKTVRTPKDNDLIENEARVLKKMHNDVLTKDNVNTLQLVPKVTDTFTNLSGKVNQSVIVFQGITKVGYSLPVLREKFPKGIPLEHAAWMFNRLTGALENPHLLGIAHAGLIPENIVFYPSDHGATIYNWDFATEEGTKVKGALGSPLDRVYYAPEVQNKEPVTLSADLYSLAKIFLYMVGGSVNANKFPDWQSLDPAFWQADKLKAVKKIEGIIRACLLGKAARTQSVASVYVDFREALVPIFGPPKWRDFIVP